LLGGIDCIELPIATLRGSWKASQNRSLADRLGVAAGLGSREDSQARALGEIVMRSGGN
jgi:transcriptional regulator